MIEHWIGSVTAERDAEGLTTDADTHVMFGYAGAPPHWPSVGQLKAWLNVLRAIPEPDMRGDVVERVARNVSAIVFAHLTCTGGFEYADVAATKEIAAALNAAYPGARHE